jgi:hypothetical protein
VIGDQHADAVFRHQPDCGLHIVNTERINSCSPGRARTTPI